MVLNKSRLLRTLLFASRRGLAARSTAFSSPKSARIVFKTPFLRPSIALGTLTICSLYFASQGLLSNDVNQKNESSDSVGVDKSISPFPTELVPPFYPLTTKYVLMGFGTRSVTFLSFKVYGLGLYVAEQDLSLLSNLLCSSFLSKTFIDTDSTKSHPENVKATLQDPEKSRKVVDNLLDAGVRMAAKITPIRNTDFNHLRDGLIKSILSHPNAKTQQEAMNAGIQMLKEAFSKKGSVPKDDDLILELQANGSLQLYYLGKKKNEKVVMGRIDEPLIGKCLFSQYLSGPKPLSQSAKDSFVDKLVTLV
ncbi:LAMI_0C03686g1_1 [Lachancea mirantina]|uniref:Altered inheritance of mitochondria protein 18, mitochondrial n=1 Tax=Lachancea mirantina TaxID=1230905 RepID=A0A1G4J1N4_9SACH|nr:LAMI_0C03686g1_1 [Lachancea mirantina]